MAHDMNYLFSLEEIRRRRLMRLQNDDVIGAGDAPAQFRANQISNHQTLWSRQVRSESSIQGAHMSYGVDTDQTDMRVAE
jgi:hypothetical protein